MITPDLVWLVENALESETYHVAQKRRQIGCIDGYSSTIGQHVVEVILTRYLKHG